MSTAPETIRRCDTLDMVLVHRVFRREFAVLPALVRAVPDRHLQERHVLPLVEQYVTESEWAEVGDRGMASMPKSRLVAFLAYILEETTPAERAHFMRQVPLPGRIAYQLVGKRKHRAESRQLRAALNGRRNDEQ
jgi:hypothetical protein